MSKMGRNKGANGEREVFKLLSDLLGFEIKRNLKQYQSGQFSDTESIEHVALEVKRCETILLKNWWSQTVDAAINTNKLPVLCYRKSRAPWTFIVPMSFLRKEIIESDCALENTCSISLETFVQLYKEISPKLNK